MPRAVIRFLANLSIVLAPFLTLHWSILDLFGWGDPATDGLVHLRLLGLLPLVGTKEQVELKLALSMVATAVVFMSAAEVFDVYLPKQDLEQFRREYLDDQSASGFDRAAESRPCSHTPLR